ncbi:MAG: DMT family transporter, partial [Pseudomonadales bacterium]|nr:DMT family transporter [Pseudomonadales bacterium]
AGATVALWSTVATAFELGLRDLSPAALLAGANVVAVLVLALLAAGLGRLGALRGLTGADHRRALLLGALNPALYYLVLFEAYDRLPGQVAQPLNYTWAITLSLLAVPVLGHRLRAAELAAMGVAWLGVVVIATGGDPGRLQTDDPVGVALALGSTVVWAAYWLLAARDRREPVTGLLLNFVYALPLTAALALVTETRFAATPLALGAIAWVGFAEMGASFVLWLLALRRARSTAAISSLIFLSPFVSLVLLAAVAGETIRPATPAGLVLIVAGLLLQRRAGRTPG